MPGVFDENKEGLVGEMEQPAGTISQKEIDAMAKDAAEAQKDYNRRKEDKVKEIVATKKRLFDRKERLFTIKVPVDEEDDGTTVMMTFKARRLTHAERSQMEAIKPPDGYSEISAEDFVKLKNQGYDVLSKVIVEPQMEAKEWADLDVAITEALIGRITLLQIETSDATLVNDLKNLL